MKKYKVHIVWGIAVIVVLIGGFFWGKASATTSARTGLAGSFSSSTRARFGGAGGAAGGGFATGQVTAISGSSLTLQLANGNSEVVFYSSSTAVTEPTTVPISDLATGSNVMIGGTTNSDGSLTAQSIQVRPAGSAPTGGAARGTAPASQ